MRRGSCFLFLAGLLSAAPGCFLLDPTDDDDEAETDDGTSSATADSGSTAGTAGTTASTDAATASDETAAGGSCGWGPTGDEAVPEGYVCGGDGVDPSGMVPLACPEGVTLEVGAACGEDIGGTGCCGPDGNAWYCGDEGSGPALALLVC